MSENDDSDSHLGAINRLYTKSGEIRHNQVVLDWLESNASELLPDLPTKVYITTVLRFLFQQKSSHQVS